MKRFKTFAIRSITAGVAALALAGAVHAQTVKVLSIVDHPALDAIRDGVRAELKAEGYGDDKPGGNTRARRATRARPRRSRASSSATSLT